MSAQPSVTAIEQHLETRFEPRPAPRTATIIPFPQRKRGVTEPIYGLPDPDDGYPHDPLYGSPGIDLID